MSRRQMLMGTGALALSLGNVGRAFATPSGQKSSANDRVVLGLIGCGGMGASNMRNLMRFADIEVAALCDVDSARITGDFNEVEKKYGRKPDVYADYRKILDRKDIDAVIVGTPDHWHALNLIHACEAGKDAYCEKPISHNITEAVSMVGAAQRYKRVVQVGTWQRSDQEFVDAIEYIRSGRLGKIVRCRAWIADGTRLGKKPVSTPPSSLDFDAWLGPAAKVPYQSNRVHWNWRWMLNTGSGLTGDWGVHMMDIALLGMSKSQDLVMPTSVSAYGGNWAIQNDDRDAPDTTEAIFHFEDPEFVLQWSVAQSFPGRPGHGTEFVSADGRTLRVWRGGWLILDSNGKELPKESLAKRADHWRDFVDCVKSRATPRADLRSVAQTTIACHLANAALWSESTVKWDAEKWDIQGKAGKETMAYRRPYRAPHKLTRYPAA